MGDQLQNVPKQTTTPTAPLVTGGSVPTPNDTASATASIERRKKAAASVSKPWIAALGGLYPADAATSSSPDMKISGGDVEKFTAATYKLATTDAAGAAAAKEYLTAAGAPEAYLAALRMANDSVGADKQKFAELAKAIGALIHSDADFNTHGMDVLAALAMLSDEGKTFLKDDHTLVAPLEKYAGSITGDGEAVKASKNAYLSLVNALKNPVIAGKTPEVAKKPEPLVGAELDKAKLLVKKIKDVFKDVPALSIDGKTASVTAKPQQLADVKAAIAGTTDPIRDWLYTWRETEGVNAGKGLLQILGSYMAPGQVDEVTSTLDPVARLRKELAISTTRFAQVKTFLAGYPGEAGTPMRRRVQQDAQIMQVYLDHLSAEETKILLRMIATGRAEPDAIDRLHEACDAGNAQAACTAIFDIASRNKAQLDDLRADLIFVHRLKDKFSTGLINTEQKRVNFSGVDTNPYELFLRVCGINPHDTKEAGSVDKQTEANPDPNKEPLKPEELAQLENTLFKPYAQPIADQLNSWYTNDDKVMKALHEFQAAAASERMVGFLRRHKMAPGPAMASHIQSLGCDVRLKMARGLSDDNLHTAERILGFVADQATTGVIGGSGALVGDTGPQGSNPETKVGLEQALRETTLKSGAVVTEVVHLAAKEIADELNSWFPSASTVRTRWNKYKGEISDDVCANLRTKTGLPRVWPVELLANAFLPIGGGALESKLKSALGKDGNGVLTDMGMQPTDIAARRSLAQQKVEQSNAGGDAGAKVNNALVERATESAKLAEQAEAFRGPAKDLFEGLAAVNRSTTEDILRGLGAKLSAGVHMATAIAPAGVKLGPVAAPVNEDDVSARPGGPVHPDQGQPTDFTSFYKKQYGLDPKRHAAEIAKALGNRERSAAKVAELLGIDGSQLAPATAPSGEVCEVNEANVTLVSPGFDGNEARARAKKIWDLMHGQEQGAVQLMRQQFGTTQEEDRLINIAFRQLSAGIDMHFFLEQHAAQQRAWEKRDIGLDRNGLQVGGGGVGDADKRSVNVIGLAAETEAAADRAENGKLSVEKQLLTYVRAKNMNEVYRVIEAGSKEEHRAILANSELMTALREFGDDSYEWNRIYKSLTGQADLYDKLESRAHGKHGVIGGALEGTDEKGMAEDIKDHAKKRKAEIRIEQINKLFGGVEPTNRANREALDKEVNRLLKIEFQAHLENPSIRALLTSEMSNAELAKTEGLVMGAGEESKLAAVLTEGDLTEDEEKILDDIKKMSPAERKKARENPEYMTQLRKAIQTQATWRDAMIALESTEDGRKAESGDNFAKLERASRSWRQDSTEIMVEQDDIIECLSRLSPDEYKRLMDDQRLQAQVLSALEGYPDLLAKARQMMNFNVGGAAKSTGLTIASGDQKPDPEKGIYAKAAVERLAFMKFSAENQLRVGASRGWGVLLQAGVSVYNMKLTPTDAEKTMKAEESGQKEEADKPIDPSKLVPENQVGAKSQGSSNGAVTTTAQPPKTADATQTPVVDPKTGEAKVEEDLRKKILEGVQNEITTAITAWGPQSGEGSKHDRVEIDVAKQTQIIKDAITHTGDPSNVLLMASTGVFSDDEDRIKETLRKASDEKLIREWTNCLQHSPNGGLSLKDKYLAWKTARQTEHREIEPDPKPEPGAATDGSKPDVPKMKAAKYSVGSAAWKTRTAFKTHIVDTSDLFEDLLLTYTGGLFADDKKMAPGSNYVRDNKEWLEWRTIVRDRLPNLDRELVGKEIGAAGDHEAMDTLRDPQAKVLSDTLSGLEYDNERYLVDRGSNSNYNMDRATAQGEGLALDNAMDSYKQQVMGGIIAKGEGREEKYGDIDATEQAKIAEAKGRFQKNDAAFREAKSAVAQVAATVAALVITAVVTILTAGTATGPLVTILYAAITAGLASAGSQVTKEAIQGTDFDMGKEGLQAIARDTLMGAVTAGTTWYAGKIANGLFSAGSAAEQAAMVARTVADPSFFAAMGRGMVENSLQTGMQGLFESGMAAFDPAMWLDGWNEGWRRGSKAARERAQEIPVEMLRAAVIAAMSHTANAGINKMKGGAGAEPQGWHGQHAGLGNRMDLGQRTSLTMGKMAHGAREGVIMGGAELLLDEKSYRSEGVKPESMLGHVGQSSANMAQLAGMGMHMEDANGLARGKAVERNLEQHGKELSPGDQKLYKELATTQGGNDTSVLSVAEFKAAKEGMIARAEAKFEAQTDRKMEQAEKEAFRNHVNGAESLQDYIKRAEAGPHDAPGVKKSPIIPAFEKPAARESARKNAEELLEKLKAASDATSEKVKDSAAAHAEQKAKFDEAHGLLDEIKSKSVTPEERIATAELASRTQAILGELGRALSTVEGGASLEAIRGQLKAAVDAATGAPDNVDVHKALHKVMVEAAVANATTPKDTAAAAAEVPKKLAELAALIEELKHARDNAVSRERDRKQGGGDDPTKKKEAPPETKKEGTSDEQKNKDEQKEKAKDEANTDPTKKKEGDTAGGENKTLSAEDQAKLDWFYAAHGRSKGAAMFEQWQKRKADGAHGDMGKPLSDEQRKAIGDKVDKKSGDFAGDTVDKSFLSDEQADIERWQTHGLEDLATDADLPRVEAKPGEKLTDKQEKQNAAADAQDRLRKMLLNPEFRHWYDVWMSMPDRVLVNADGSSRANPPPGCPADFAQYFAGIHKAGNVGLMTRALATSKRIQAEFPGLEADPNSVAWKEARPKLVEMLGEEAVAKYEKEAGGKKTVEESERIGKLLDDQQIKLLEGMAPGAKIFVTGSGAQLHKAIETVADIDLIVVVPNDMPANVRAEIEARLQTIKIDHKNEDGSSRKLPVDAKVMSEDQFMGLSMAKVPEEANGKKRTPLSNIRIDDPSKPHPGGAGESGGDLHNHVMGIPTTHYFVDKIGGGSAATTLDKLQQLVTHPDIKPPVHAALTQGHADVMEARKLKMPTEVIEQRALRALDQAFVANESTPFDHTYDIRDLAVQTFIDPGKGAPFKNYSKDVITDLHDQGVTSSEQSVSLKKLEQRFGPDTMRDAHEKARVEGKDSKLDFLLMAPTSDTLAGKPEITKELDEKGQKKLSPIEERMRKQLLRPDVKGMDVAGPEAGKFTPEGMKWFLEQLEFLDGIAKEKNDKMVLRPHVGEGYDPSHTGEHKLVAEHNLRMIVEALESVGYNGTGNVIVRFGHGTHATPELMKRMAKLGIVVEANVGSNIATGSVLRAEEHPLLSNMFYGVKTVLATDGQGVMDTKLTHEFERASALLAQFKSGKPLVIDGREILWDMLDARQKERFSVEWLKDQLKDYQRRAGDRVDYSEGKGKDTGGGGDGGGGGGGNDRNGGGGKDSGPGPEGEGPKKEAELRQQQVARDAQIKRVNELREKIKKGTPEDKATALAELDNLRKDPEWKRAVDAAELFDKAGAEQNTTKANEATTAMSDDIQGVLDAQKEARAGKDPILQAKRETFERKLALEILRNGEIKKAIDGELGKLCQKAKDYIERTKTDKEKAYSELSTDQTKGYGGGLGAAKGSEGKQSHDASMILQVLEHGNVRERMLALAGFMEMVGKDVLSPEGRKKLEKMAQEGGADGGFGAEVAQAMIDRYTTYANENQNVENANTSQMTDKEKADYEKKRLKLLFSPSAADKSAGGKHEFYADAKGQPMDTKLPPLLQEKIAQFLKDKAKNDPTALDPKGEENPLARTTITVREAQQRGLNLSAREIEMAGGLDAKLNWVVGQVANIVNPNAKFIKDAKQSSMPLKAGISGTTFRFMEIVEVLGGNPDLARLAAIASLQGADAHSFHEIASAAQGFGVKYDPTNPYGNISALLDETMLEVLARESGTTMEELNGKKKSETDAKTGP